MIDGDEMSTRTPALGSWVGAPCPAILARSDGRILQLNDLAMVLFPQGTPGADLAAVTSGWLADPGRPVDGSVGDRSFTAHPVHDGDTVTWWLLEDTRARAAEQALRLERERAAFLSRASTALLGSLNLERCMEIAGRMACEHLADAALVIAPASRQHWPAAVCVRGGAVTQQLLDVDPDELPGLSEALQGFPPVPSRWIDPAAAPGWAIPEGFGDVGSMVVTPLPGHGVPAGALVLLRRADHQAFSEDEETFARLFAARSGTAMSAARLFAQQASITDALMRDLLPPAMPRVDGIEFAARYRPSKDTEHVGGDFYDVFPGDGETLAVLGDVCGKGLEAAVLNGKVRNTLRAVRPLGGDHHRMLTLLNGALLDPSSARFVTLVMASAVRRGHDLELRLTAAGHPPPLIVRTNGTVEEAATRGTLVGVLPEIRTTTTTTTLAPGETCLLYTDGIAEARGGPLGEEMFGEARLHSVLAECGGMPAEAVVERVQMVAAQWVGRQNHDDMAVLAITSPRGQHLTAVGGHGRGRYTA
ncbi:PP2C family protein-serine/threonine phosphatase [Kutzneria sp. NPDC052558]|uniref:PP2C family protein-serine/threonine phosphatase n=1 Tax=Kutzneria sp. NPDC052558 TaxID=3364121 RepID=UPI0037CAE9F4